LTQAVVMMQSKKINGGELTVVLTKTFGLGFKHMKVNVQNIFLFIY